MKYTLKSGRKYYPIQTQKTRVGELVYKTLLAEAAQHDCVFTDADYCRVPGNLGMYRRAFAHQMTEQEFSDLWYVFYLPDNDRHINAIVVYRDWIEKE